MPAHGVMFQHFHDDFHPPGQGSINASNFVAIINQFDRRNVIPAGEWLERATSNTLRDHDLCLTFDGGLLCQYDLAVPVLRDLGLTAFFFVPTAVHEGDLDRTAVYRYFRETSFESLEHFYAAFYEELSCTSSGPRVKQAMLRFNPREYLAHYPFYTLADRKFRFVRDDVIGPDAYEDIMTRMLASAGVNLSTLAKRLWMSADQIRALHADGHVIGLHSHTHPTRLAKMSPQQQRDEYGQNWRAIRQITGHAPTAMSHPCNSYSPYTLSLLRQLGVRIGFRTNMVQSPYCALEQPRIDQAMLARTARESIAAAA